MELDHRAAEAAALLRDEVDAVIDPDTAYGQVLAGVSKRRARTAGTRLGVAALVALVAVGALAVVTAGGGTGPIVDDGDRDRNVDEYTMEEGLVVDGDITERAAAMLGGLPDGPLDGKESQRLPVIADPADGVSEGDQVTLVGKGFEPGELVGAVHCASEADVQSSGTDACDLGESFGNTVTTNARFDGSVVVTVTIRRHITTPGLGPVDCASGPERCLLAIGAASDYDRSGGTYVQFADAPRFPEATSTIDPAGPYTAGQQVTITGSTLVPHRQYQVEQCVDGDHCATLASGRADPQGVYGATVTIGSSVDMDGVVEECGDGCTLQVRGVGLTEQTTANPPAPIPLGPLLGGDTVVTSPTPTTAPPSPDEAIPPVEEPTTPTTAATSPTDPAVTSEPATTAPATTTAPPTTG